MKDLFRGYYRLSDEEIEKIWGVGFIALDTNVLCNLYRYSDETRVELIKSISTYSQQLWLPYHVAAEFHRNRPFIISEQIKIYDSTIDDIKKIEDAIVKNLKTPHLSAAVVAQFKEVIEASINDLKQKKEFYHGLLKDDTILQEITELFDGKVGPAFTDEEITGIEKEGEKRYKKELPPGYKDSSKAQNKFGDLIIWKELIKKSKEATVPFIFIMDDLKEDWWLRVHGQTISPRPELLQELHEEAKQTFYLYDSHRFLQFAAKTKDVKQAAIDEVKEVSKENIEYFKSSIANYLDTFKKYDVFKAKPLSQETLEKLGLINKFGLNADYWAAAQTLSKLNASLPNNRVLTKMQALMDNPYFKYSQLLENLGTSDNLNAKDDSSDINSETRSDEKSQPE